MCKLFLIVSPIISELESIHNSRFESQELAKGTASATRAAGGEKVNASVLTWMQANGNRGLLLAGKL